MPLPEGAGKGVPHVRAVLGAIRNTETELVSCPQTVPGLGSDCPVVMLLKVRYQLPEPPGWLHSQGVTVSEGPGLGAGSAKL